MDHASQNKTLLEFEHMSRSDRWLALRKYLIELNGSISAAADVANEEAQREISLTLNDDIEYGSCCPEPIDGARSLDLSEAQFITELRKLPHIGIKAAQTIATYVALARDDKVLDFAYSLTELNADIASRGIAVQPTLDLD